MDMNHLGNSHGHQQQQFMSQYHQQQQQFNPQLFQQQQANQFNANNLLNHNVNQPNYGHQQQVPTDIFTFLTNQGIGSNQQQQLLNQVVEVGMTDGRLVQGSLIALFNSGFLPFTSVLQYIEQSVVNGGKTCLLLNGNNNVPISNVVHQQQQFNQPMIQQQPSLPFIPQQSVPCPSTIVNPCQQQLVPTTFDVGHQINAQNVVPIQNTQLIDTQQQPLQLLNQQLQQLHHNHQQQSEEDKTKKKEEVDDGNSSRVGGTRVDKEDNFMRRVREIIEEEKLKIAQQTSSSADKFMTINKRVAALNRSRVGIVTTSPNIVTNPQVEHQDTVEAEEDVPTMATETVETTTEDEDGDNDDDIEEAEEEVEEELVNNEEDIPFLDADCIMEEQITMNSCPSSPSLSNNSNCSSSGQLISDHLTSNDTRLATVQSSVARAIGSSSEPTKTIVDGVNLEEIKEFAHQFKMTRVKLGLTQSQVGQAISAIPGTSYSQSAICRFEKLEVTPKAALKIKPVLESWMREAEEMYQNGQLFSSDSIFGSNSNKTRKKRTTYDEFAKVTLETYFNEVTTHPDTNQMAKLAAELNDYYNSYHDNDGSDGIIQNKQCNKFNKEGIRVWFCNRRQKSKNEGKELPLKRRRSSSSASSSFEVKATETTPAGQVKGNTIEATTTKTMSSNPQVFEKKMSMFKPIAPSIKTTIIPSGQILAGHLTSGHTFNNHHITSLPSSTLIYQLPQL